MARWSRGSPVSIPHRTRSTGAALAPTRQGRVSRILHHHRSQRPTRLRHYLPARALAFFTDYDRFYRRRQKGSVQFDFHADRQQIAEPLKVAYLFVEKRDGRASPGIPYVPSKDVETAKYLLTHVAFSDIPDFLDYALVEAKKTRFDVQTLGGLKQYLSRYQERCAQRTAAKASRVRHEAEDKATRRRMDYDRFRRAAADRLFSTLPAKERAAIETAAHAKAPRFGRGNGSLTQTMFEIERARITAQRYPGKILSLEEWQRRSA